MSNSEFQESLRVVRGNPTPEELAAVIALVEAAAAEEPLTSGVAKRPPRSTWNRGHGHLRSNLAPGLGQWNAAFRDGLN
ncbi:MAG: acyl-CoA carboxylase subunit epsilon [Micrococcales bacterium]